MGPTKSLTFSRGPKGCHANRSNTDIELDDSKLHNILHNYMFFNLYFGGFSKTGNSGDSWMYPYQRTPMGNPYISPIYPYIVGVYGLLSPRIPI